MRAFRYVFYIILIVVTLELTLKLLGYKAYSPTEFQMNNIKMDPLPLFRQDSVLGYRLNAGKIRIYYPDTINYWETTQNQKGYRITSDYPEEIDSAKNSIHILGDSFTHGSGLKNEETYPYLLQKKLKSRKVNNWGVGGYGVVNVYLQLLKDIKIEKGDVVLYSYMKEHNNRATKAALKKMYPSKKEMEQIKFIYADENMNFEYKSFHYDPLPYIANSVLMNCVDNVVNKCYDYIHSQDDVAKQMLLEMNKYCHALGAVFIFVGIQKDKKTSEMLQFCNTHKIPNTDIAVNLSDKKFNLMPLDNHPNAYANTIFADKIEKYLNRFAY